MEPVDTHVLTELARHHGWPAMSLFSPMHRAGSAKEQDPIRLKNLAREGCAQLVAQGMREADAERFCAPVTGLIDDPTFRRLPADGLAIFASETGVSVIRLDVSVPEQAVVGDRFYLRPLLAAHRGDDRFFALSIDRNGCRLLRGDGASIEPVELEGVPASLAEELQYDEAQPGLQYSSVPTPATAAGGGRPTGAVFHGHGGERDVDKSNLERYLRKVEAGVSRAVSCESGVPIVLFGVDYSLALYRTLNTCAALADEQVTGSAADMPDHEIHARALEALKPRLAARTAAQLAALDEARGKGLASDDAVEIATAAAAGRVKTLLFDDSVGPFGVLDRETGQASGVCASAPRMLRESADAAAPEGACGWDLVDLAAAETLLHGGEVVAFTGEDSPVSGVSAIYRY